MKKVVSMMFLCVCLFLAGCKKEGIAQASVDNIFKSLEKAGFAAQVVPFTPTATDDINDLLPLSAVFANTQVVGWGEATHGSAEFQSMKHRAFQLLSTRLNFRALVIEENFSAVIPVNEYVLTGTGHVNSLLAGLRSNMFKTLEFKQLVEWMKTYNTGKAAADKLQLWGMDAQNTGYSAKAVQQMVAAYEPGYLAEYNQKAVAFLQDLTNYPSEQAALAALPELQAQWANIRQHIEGNSHTYINGAGSKGYQLLQQHLAVIGQALHQFTGFSLGMNEGFARRDKHMADNVKWVENYMGSGSKLMVWAHNGHINVQPQDYFGKGPIEVLGTHLKSQYGKGFYAVAFVFAQGDFEAVNANTGQLQVFTLPLYKETVLSNALSRFVKSSFFYDLQGSSQPALYQVFNKTYPFYQLGAGYDGKIENALMDFNLAKEFDGFVFVNTTKASNKL